MKLAKELKTALIVLGLIIVVLVIYGLITDCPNTAGYFFCSESERELIRQ